MKVKAEIQLSDIGGGTYPFPDFRFTVSSTIYLPIVGPRVTALARFKVRKHAVRFADAVVTDMEEAGYSVELLTHTNNPDE